MDKSRARRSRSIATLLLAACVALSTGTVAAQDKGAEAAKLFEQGSHAFERNEFAAAAMAFEAAHKLLPHGATIYNAALAWDATAEKARAADAFLEAITFGGLTDTQLADASRKLKNLERTLGRVEMRAPIGARVTVLHLHDAAVPLRTHLPFGSHIVRVDYADGTTRYHPVQTSADPLSVEMRPEAGAVSSEAASRPPDPATPSRHGSTQRLAGWITLGGAAAFSGAAIFLGLQGWSARDEFVDSGATNQDAHDRATSYRTWANVMWLGAGLAGAAGGALLLTAPSTKTDQTRAGSSRGAGMTLGLGAGSVSLSGRF